MIRLAVLVSGGGTNLQRIIDAIHTHELQKHKITCVIADRECFATERAKKSNIPHHTLERNAQLSDTIHTLLYQKADYIILAGFLSILDQTFCENWQQKIINIHPSLLPKYGGKGMYGDKVHQAVLDNHEEESGATVHFVTTGIDEGAIILQQKTPVFENDTVESLANRIHQIEYSILIEAIKLL